VLGYVLLTLVLIPILVAGYVFVVRPALAPPDPLLVRMYDAWGTVDTFAYVATGTLAFKVEGEVSPYLRPATVEAEFASRGSVERDDARSRSQHDLDLSYVIATGEMTLRDVGRAAVVADSDGALYVTVRTLPGVAAYYGVPDPGDSTLMFDSMLLGSLGPSEEVLEPERVEPVEEGGIIRDTLGIRSRTTGDDRARKRAERLRALLSEHPPLSLLDTGTVESVDPSGSPRTVTRYALGKDANTVRAFFAGIIDDEVFGLARRPGEREAVMAAVERVGNDLSVEGSELWVREDGLPQRLLLELSLSADMRDLVEGGDEVRGGGRVSYHLTLDLWFYGYNDPVPIVVPRNAIPYDTFLEEKREEAAPPTIETPASTPTSTDSGTTTVEQVATTSPATSEASNVRTLLLPVAAIGSLFTRQPQPR
jgi:hypothetical protein